MALPHATTLMQLAKYTWVEYEWHSIVFLAGSSCTDQCSHVWTLMGYPCKCGSYQGETGILCSRYTLSCLVALL
jgi:hypothetical protein